MKIKMSKSPLSLAMPNGNVMTGNEIDVTSNLYVNGDNAEEAITDYLDEHPELIGNDTVATSVSNLESYASRKVVLMRNGSRVNDAKSSGDFYKIRYEGPSADSVSTYTAAYLNGEFDAINDELDGLGMTIQGVVGTKLIIG